MMISSLLCNNLCKSFGKKRIKKQVVKDLSLSVAEEEVFGFLGPNGAGKSTTIKMILGFLRPDSGSIEVSGIGTGLGEYRHLIGYLPELPFFYNHLTALETLMMSGKLSGMKKKEVKDSATHLLERLTLNHAAGQKVGGFSKGMKQRLGLANALVHDPPILILDEPMSGLDPLGRYQVKQLIRDLKTEGKTVFFSSHILSDIEELCDRIAIIHMGELLYSGSVVDFVADNQNLEDNFIDIIRQKEEACFVAA